MYKGVRDDQAGRLTFAFSTSYFWASFGSSTAYKHLLFVSVMAPDATEAEYNEYPTRFTVSYDGRRKLSTTALGSGILTVREGTYTQNSLREPAYELLYVDRARRLQIAWHAVKSEVDLATATDLIGRMAASFRILREPAAAHRAPHRVPLGWTWRRPRGRTGPAASAGASSPRENGRSPIATMRTCRSRGFRQRWRRTATTASSSTSTTRPPCASRRSRTTRA